MKAPVSVNTDAYITALKTNPDGSFAFNVNNFVNIDFLTGCGPPSNDQSVAGATDILITYTYKIAFESGKGQDYGLASAVSILIFFIIGTISAVSFWRSKSLENLA